MTPRIEFRSERGAVLIGLMTATALIALDTMVLATAIPAITGELGGFDAFPWLFSGYMLAAAATIPIYAKVADRVGRKPAILFGIGLFLVGSVLCATAWSMPVLIVARVLQGVGAGAIQPVSQTIVGDLYPVRERARAQGFLSGVWSIAAVVGPAIGGVFSQLDAWRWIFLVNIPICALAAWLIWQRYHEHGFQPVRARIDLLGAFLVVATSTLALFGILEGGTAWEWLSVPSMALVGGAGLLFACFIMVERRAADPIVPLDLFRHRAVSASSVGSFAIGAALAGINTFVPIFLQISAGLPPALAGLVLIPYAAGWIAGPPIAGALYLRRGFRFAAVTGGSLIAVAAIALAPLALSHSPWYIGLVSLVAGLGFGIASTTVLIAAPSSALPERRGVTTGLIAFFRSLGQATGAAIFGAIAKAVISANGGDETDPDAFAAAMSSVYVGIGIVAVVLVISATALPRAVEPHSR